MNSLELIKRDWPEYNIAEVYDPPRILYREMSSSDTGPTPVKLLGVIHRPEAEGKVGVFHETSTQFHHTYIAALHNRHETKVAALVASIRRWESRMERLGKEIERESARLHQLREQHAAMVRQLARLESQQPCCDNEDRDINGGCRNCGDPCL